jgi:Uma2 family endonuclease
MAMALKLHRWSRADLARLPDDGNRYEVLDGQLFVTPLPGPPHQVIAFRLMRLLAPYLERQSLGCVFGPGAVVFGKNELQPDVVVFPVEEGALTEKWDDLPRPTLVVEVLSRTTRRRDLHDKRKAYLRLEIPEYWVIDRFQSHALRWRPGDADPVVETEAIVWHHAGATEPLVIRLEEILTR